MRHDVSCDIISVNKLFTIHLRSHLSAQCVIEESLKCVYDGIRLGLGIWERSYIIQYFNMWEKERRWHDFPLKVYFMSPPCHQYFCFVLCISFSYSYILKYCLLFQLYLYCTCRNGYIIHIRTGIRELFHHHLHRLLLLMFCAWDALLMTFFCLFVFSFFFGTTSRTVCTLAWQGCEQRMIKEE